MLRVLKSPEAENDLDEIWLYIAQDNPDCADKLLDERGCKIDCVNGQNRLKSQFTGGTDGHDRRTARHFDERLQETR
ncbi:MAG: type II toxin-antitoxin system RelE/ParE family toxin, partial [Geobacteraceae bacterium]|nr:type II toxin-antitoxin system RelE/ParE family toxin [Geobacteraceae bacterium]